MRRQDVIDMLGLTCGHWKVISREGNTKSGDAAWRCICACGTKRVISGTSLRLKKTKSCGCADAMRLGTSRRLHGGSASALYLIWKGLRSRRAAIARGDRGDRPISIAPAWDNFEYFRDWAHSKGYSDGDRLRRSDKSRDYSDENCYWVAPKEDRTKDSSDVTLGIPINKKIIDLTGRKFEKLLVISYAGRRSKTTYWKCVCDCGNERLVASENLKRGLSKSCGCYRRDSATRRSTIHGRANSPEYSAWCRLLQLCYNSQAKQYHLYGARGVSVCKEWRENFLSFLQDMGSKPSKQHQIAIDKSATIIGKKTCSWTVYKKI